MATLIELVSDIVASHASTSSMSSDELVQEIQKVHAALKALEAGQSVAALSGEESKPAITVKEAFKKNEVICMVCGKGKMKTITRHLSMVHNMKPGEYKKQFGIATKQPLTAKSYSASRKKMAIDRGLADNLAKAREIRAANIKAEKPAPAKLIRPRVNKPAIAKTATPKVAKKTE